MKNGAALIVFLLCIFLHSNAQIIFEKGLDLLFHPCGPLLTNSLTQSFDHGYVVAGRQVGNYAYNFFWTKIDSSGHFVWFKNLGASWKSTANSISTTSDGGY